MPKVKFFDLKTKKSFMSDKFTTFTRKVRGRTVTFARAKNPSGNVSVRIMSNKK